MIAKTILNFIQGKTVDYTTQKVERWYREEYDATAEAFKFMRKDAGLVLEMVYQYHAQIMIARDLLSEPRTENADYLSVCVRVPKRSERDDVEELISEVEKMIEQSSGLRTQVRARVINHIETSQARLRTLRDQLRQEERSGKNFELLRYTAIAIKRVSQSRDRFRADKMMAQRTGNTIDYQLYEALALLDNVKTLIRDNQDGFAVIVKECNLWMNNWNHWDYSRGMGRDNL